MKPRTNNENKKSLRNRLTIKLGLTKDKECSEDVSPIQSQNEYVIDESLEKFKIDYHADTAHSSKRKSFTSDDSPHQSKLPDLSKVPSKTGLRGGYLTKLGELRKNWKKRFFILTNETLDYYSSIPNIQQQPIHSIPLVGCKILLAEEIKKPFCFQIWHPFRRTFYIHSDKEDDMKIWIGLIKQVIDNLSNQAKIGTFIHEPDSSYELVYDMLLGIRHTVSKHTPQESNQSELEPSDFSKKLKYEIKRGGKKATDIHSKYNFTFTDFAPSVFVKLRKIYGIDPADYLISLTQEYILSELGTPGKSGSFFYFSYDYNFLIKTLTKSEFNVLEQMLPHYFEHCSKNEHTLLSKFCGMHKLSRGLKSTYIVVMCNIFSPLKSIHKKFDLKGSTQGRRATEKEKKKRDVVYKDMDINQPFFLGSSDKERFIDQITRDTEFLQSMKVMDYSLLVGIHYQNQRSRTEKLKERSYSRVVERLLQDGETPQIDFLPVRQADLPPPKQINYKSFFCKDDGGIQATQNDGALYSELYYFGIIDILQEYTLKKQLEHSYKTKRYETEEISSVEPRKYASRFKTFIISNVGWREFSSSEHPIQESNGEDLPKKSGQEEPKTEETRKKEQGQTEEDSDQNSESDSESNPDTESESDSDSQVEENQEGKENIEVMKNEGFNEASTSQ